MIDVYKPLKDVLALLISSNDEKTIALGQLVLFSFNWIARRLENVEGSSQVVEEVLIFVKEVIAAKSSQPANPAFDSSALIALSQLCVCIENKAIPHISSVLHIILDKVTSQ